MYLVNGNKKFGTLEFFQVMTTILFQILQTKIMIFGNTTNTTYWLSFKQYNFFLQFKNMKFAHSLKLCHM